MSRASRHSAQGVWLTLTCPGSHRAGRCASYLHSHPLLASITRRFRFQFPGDQSPAPHPLKPSTRSFLSQAVSKSRVIETPALALLLVARDSASRWPQPWAGGALKRCWKECHQHRVSRGRAARQITVVIPSGPGAVFLEVCLKNANRHGDKNKVSVEALFLREILEAFQSFLSVWV